jgi:hypothetical protein
MKLKRASLEEKIPPALKGRMFCPLHSRPGFCKVNIIIIIHNIIGS